jgi:hypothetical protein
MPIAVREVRHVKAVESCGHCERRWADFVRHDGGDRDARTERQRIMGRPHALEVAAEKATLGCGSPITYDRTLGIHVKGLLTPDEEE